MKKLIQICSVLCLVFAFSIIPANAQTTKKLQADIPFDFNLGGNYYRAGNYDLRVTFSNTSAIVLLTDGENKILDTFLVAVAPEAASGRTQLVFNNYGDGQRFLSRITTRERIYKVSPTRVERQIASGKKRAEKKPEIISISAAN